MARTKAGPPPRYRRNPNDESVFSHNILRFRRAGYDKLWEPDTPGMVDAETSTFDRDRLRVAHSSWGTDRGDRVLYGAWLAEVTGAAEVAIVIGNVAANTVDARPYVLGARKEVESLSGTNEPSAISRKLGLKPTDVVDMNIAFDTISMDPPLSDQQRVVVATAATRLFASLPPTAR